MNAVESGAMLLIQVAGDRFVGEEHELLDQLMGFVGRLLFDPVRFALGIEENSELRKIEVEGALDEALLPKRGGKVPSALEEAVEIVLSRTAEPEKGLRISEAVAGVDDGAGEASGPGLALRIQPNESGVGQALLVGAKGAEPIGEAGREHGNDPVDEVDAVGAFAGFVVQFGSGFDVVGDVGDVNADFDVALGKFAKGDGVIEIAGGIGIDGDNEVAPQIFPANGAIGEFDGGKGFGFGQSFGGKGGGEIKFANDGEDVDPRVGGAAEAFDEKALGVGAAIFPIDQFGDDFVAGLGLGGALGPRGGDVEIVEEARVIRNDDKEAGGFLESANDEGGAAFENAEDAAAEAVGRGRAAATGGGSGPAIDAGNDEVAVEGGAGVLGGDVKIGRAIGRNDKSEAFGMELDGAGDEIGIAGGDVVVLPNPSERAVLFEGVESTGDGGEGDAETFGEGGWIERGGFFALEKSKEAIGQAAGGRHRFELRMIPRFDETPILSR